MDKTPVPELHAVVATPDVTPPLWFPLPPKPWPPFVRLWAGATAADVSLFMLVAATSRPEGTLPPAKLQALLLDFPRSLPGGLGAVHGELAIMPSCCCGLEDWREWESVLTGGAPWMGHDPTPSVQRRQDQVLVLPDAGEPADSPQAIRFEISGFQHCLRQAEADLDGFLKPLRNWLEPYSEALAADLIACFRAGFMDRL